MQGTLFEPVEPLDRVTDVFRRLGWQPENVRHGGDSITVNVHGSGQLPPTAVRELRQVLEGAGLERIIALSWGGRYKRKYRGYWSVMPSAIRWVPGINAAE